MRFRNLFHSSSSTESLNQQDIFADDAWLDTMEKELKEEKNDNNASDDDFLKKVRHAIAEIEQSQAFRVNTDTVKLKKRRSEQKNSHSFIEKYLEQEKEGVRENRPVLSASKEKIEPQRPENIEDIRELMVQPLSWVREEIADEPMRTEPEQYPVATTAMPEPAEILKDPEEIETLEIEKGVKLEGVVAGICKRLDINGTVSAMIYDIPRVSIGESGEFKGKGVFHILEVFGKITGDCVVLEQLIIHPTGTVSGAIQYTAIDIKPGGKIKGMNKSLSRLEANRLQREFMRII